MTVPRNTSLRAPATEANTMPVTDQQVLWLRAYLDDEMGILEQLNPQVATDSNANGLSALVYAAFVISARREFAPTWTRLEVIQFVSRVRALLPERIDTLDPLVAENLLRTALGERSADSPEPQAQARAQLILLRALITKAAPDDAAIFDLLSEARAMANQLLIEQ